jgi:hypothetical protein
MRDSRYDCHLMSLLYKSFGEHRIKRRAGSTVREIIWRDEEDLHAVGLEGI